MIATAKAPSDHAADTINGATANLAEISATRLDTTAALAAVQAQATLAIASALLAVADAIGKAADHA